MLDEAAVKNPNIEWDEWFRKVSLVFKHRIPEALLLGLSKQSDILKILCDEYRGNSKPKPRPTHEERYQNWVKRRDEGNQRAVQKAIKEDASSPPKEILSTFVMTDDEIKEKMPVWQEQFNTIMDKRQQEQEDVWRFVVK